MIKQAGILLTLCATSLVVINIRTLETVERSGRGIDDDDPYNDKDDYEVRRGTGYWKQRSGRTPVPSARPEPICCSSRIAFSRSDSWSLLRSWQSS